MSRFKKQGRKPKKDPSFIGSDSEWETDSSSKGPEKNKKESNGHKTSNGPQGLKKVSI